VKAARAAAAGHLELLGGQPACASPGRWETSGLAIERRQTVRITN